MHLVIPTHVYFFWMRCHPNRTTLPKEVEWEPQNKLPLLPTTWPHPLIPLTCGSPLLYWLRTGRWCLSLMCTPLPSKSIAFLALTCLPLPLGLSNSTVRSNICLILATWMIHGSLSFRSLHPISFSNWALLGCGFSPFYLAHVPFCPTSVGYWCSCHATALLLLWYHLSFYLFLPLGLQTEAPTMPISYIIPSFGLFCQTFLLGQLIPCLGHLRPILFFEHPQPILFFLTSFTPMSFLLNLLGFPGSITTSLPFGLIGLYANTMNLLIPFLGFPNPFILSLNLLQFSWVYYFIPWASSTIFLFFGHLLFCGPVDHYSCHFGLMVFILLFSFFIFFILLGFFCHWALLSKVGINIEKISTQQES